MFFTLTSDFLCCTRLLGEFLLSFPNKLLRTYQDLYVVMKEIGRKYQAIDACPNDHIIYNGQYGSKTNCPKCNYNRYQYDKITKKVPQKFLRHIPIIPCL